MSDPRDTFANERIADVALQGPVKAPRFAKPRPMRVTAPVADIRAAPEASALERQVLYGQRVDVLETSGTAAFVRAADMGYVGYIGLSSLGPWVAPTHVVAVRTTFAFAAPHFKTPRPVALSLGSRIAVAADDGDFARTSDGQYIPSGHLRAMAPAEPDPAAVAERLIGTTYLWGGNSAFGIDCSGLVQIALLACGMPCPGDSDQQAARVGTELPPSAPLQRNDIVFWRGHVGMMLDASRLIHANAHHMAVVIEPFEEAAARIAAGDTGPVTLRRRP